VDGGFFLIGLSMAVVAIPAFIRSWRDVRAAAGKGVRRNARGTDTAAFWNTALIHARPPRRADEYRVKK